MINRFDDTLKKYISQNGLNQLKSFWISPNRHYHNINHLIDVIEYIENSYVFSICDVAEKHILLIAAFFHDAIYESNRNDNEDRSINFLRYSYIHDNLNILNEVIKCIEVTKYRKVPIGKLQSLFWMADNAILTRDLNILKKYEELIRRECSYISNRVYRKKRIDFIKSNLGLFGKNVDANLNDLIEYIEKKYN